jgi:hypothetical protein
VPQDKHFKTRQFLGKKLADYRGDAAISAEGMAKAARRGRQYAHLVEAGKVNFTINSYLDMLDACSVSFDELLRAVQTSDIPEKHRPLHDMLSVILNSNNDDLTHGITINLKAISEMARRLTRQRPRSSPAVKQEGGDRKEGDIESPRAPQRKRAGASG